MDPISVVGSACSLALSIQAWLADHKTKEEVMHSLSNMIDRVCKDLTPFDNPEVIKCLDNNVIGAFNGIRDVLLRTNQHLTSWGPRRGKRFRFRSLFSDTIVFLVPSQVICALKQDEQDLNTQLLGVLFTLSLNSLLKEARRRGVQTGIQTHQTLQEPIASPEPDSEILDITIPVPPSLTPSFSPPLSPSSSYLSVVSTDPNEFLGDLGNRFRNDEVRQFWKEHIGVKVVWTTEETFHRALQEYTRLSIGRLTMKKVMASVDEFKLGGVSHAHLDRLVNEAGSFRSFLQRFQGEGDVRSNHEPEPAVQSQLPRLPMILWVDDNPENNADLMSYAGNLGIQIVTVKSTDAAKEWVDSNSDFLKSEDVTNQIRVISDNTRMEVDALDESNQQNRLNYHAGRDVIRHLRTNQHNFPVLIFCQGITFTRFVETYSMCGSTSSTDVVKSYIRALSKGKDDTKWNRYNAGASIGHRKSRTRRRSLTTSATTAFQARGRQQFRLSGITLVSA